MHILMHTTITTHHTLSLSHTQSRMSGMIRGLHSETHPSWIPLFPRDSSMTPRSCLVCMCVFVYVYVFVHARMCVFIFIIVCVHCSLTHFHSLSLPHAHTYTQTLTHTQPFSMTMRWQRIFLRRMRPLPNLSFQKVRESI
jgi:hypothetical protein